ncbi:MAG: hypothetical protein ACE37N_13930 [Pseudohongiellaceae bacterium]
MHLPLCSSSHIYEINDNNATQLRIPSCRAKKLVAASRLVLNIVSSDYGAREGTRIRIIVVMPR